MTALGEENNMGPADSIDVVFTAYWQYPAKVRIILPEDKACIENYRNLSKSGIVCLSLYNPNQAEPVTNRVCNSPY